MTRIAVKDSERRDSRLSDDSLGRAVEALASDGCVALEEAVDEQHLNRLRDRALDDLEIILARPDVPFNFNTGNVQQDPPPFPPFLFRDVLTNDLVIQVTRAVLGPGLRNVFYSGNTALPCGKRQPVHPDSGQLWQGLETAPPAYALVVNVPLVPVTPENGATEIWPGTHVDTTHSVHEGSPRVGQSDLERRRAQRPPVQPHLPLGSVLIRDIRLWHAGMPNHTNVPRPMVAMIHVTSWYAWDAPLVFRKGSEPFLKHPELRTPAVFTDDEPDYLRRNTAYDLR